LINPYKPPSTTSQLATLREAKQQQRWRIVPVTIFAFFGAVSALLCVAGMIQATPRSMLGTFALLALIAALFLWAARATWRGSWIPMIIGGLILVVWFLAAQPG